MIRLVPSFVCVLLSAISIALPNINRRGLLFAVPVTADFRATPAARRSVAEYRALILAAALVDLFALLFSPEKTLGAALVASPLMILAASTAAFLRERRKVLPFAIQPSEVRSAVLSAAPDRVPGYVWFGAGPFAILGAAAGFLYTHWDSIPARYAVHWTAEGQPNRWIERSVRGVYGPLIFGAEICAFILVLALAGWYGARRSRIRPVMLRTLIAGDHAIALMFAGIALHPAAGVPVWASILLPVAVLLAILIPAALKLRGGNTPLDPTPNAAWKAGMFYYNPDDPALFVEKRAGVGYTMNMGNRFSWIMAAWLAVMIASVFVLL